MYPAFCRRAQIASCENCITPLNVLRSLGRSSRRSALISTVRAAADELRAPIREDVHECTTRNMRGQVLVEPGHVIGSITGHLLRGCLSPIHTSTSTRRGRPLIVSTSPATHSRRPNDLPACRSAAGLGPVVLSCRMRIAKHGFGNESCPGSRGKRRWLERLPRRNR